VHGLGPLENWDHELVPSSRHGRVSVMLTCDGPMPRSEVLQNISRIHCFRINTESEHANETNPSEAEEELKVVKLNLN